jgi:Ion transport protein
MIALSSIMLALDNPLNDPNGGLSNFLKYSDYVFTSIFGFELILRFIVYGVLFNGEKSYLRNSANIMDFLIVALSILSLSLSNVDGLQIIKIFRLMRVLRPLRIISRNKLLKIAIQALYKALPSIFNVIIVSLFFFIIFGIIGINYFKGAFYECYIGDRYPLNIVQGYRKSVVTKFDCLNVGGTWKNSD